MSAQHYDLQHEMTSKTGKLITYPRLSLVHTQKIQKYLKGTKSVKKSPEKYEKYIYI
jgi:hypothetical protein